MKIELVDPTDPTKRVDLTPYVDAVSMTDLAFDRLAARAYEYYLGQDRPGTLAALLEAAVEYGFVRHAFENWAASAAIVEETP